MALHKGFAESPHVALDPALPRYAHPFYNSNQRLTACGYNLFNLGGI